METVADNLQSPATSSLQTTCTAGDSPEVTRNQIARGHHDHILANNSSCSGKQQHKDSKNCENNMPSEESICQRLEQQHVNYVYNHIAAHFSSTRYAAWPKVADFLKSLSPGSLVYDIGCGNGKYAQVNPCVVMIGADSSVQLLSFCREKGMPAVGAEAKKLPFRSDSADHLICIAMLHHLASHENRLTALKELIRVVKPNGTGLVTVWAFEQNKHGSDSKYISSNKNSCRNNKSFNDGFHGDQILRQHSEEVLREVVTEDTGKGVITDATLDANEEVDQKEVQERDFLNNSHSLKTSATTDKSSRHNTCSTSSPQNTLVIHKNRTAFEAQDVLVPWKCRDSGKTFLRYYHVFVENELSRLCQEVRGVTIIQELYDQGNWCLIFRKEEQNCDLEPAND